MANRVLGAVGPGQLAMAAGTAIALTTLFTYLDADGASQIVSFKYLKRVGLRLVHNGTAWPADAGPKPRRSPLYLNNQCKEQAGG